MHFFLFPNILIAGNVFLFFITLFLSLIQPRDGQRIRVFEAVGEPEHGKHDAGGFVQLKQHGLAPLLTHCWVQGSFGIFTIASKTMQL